nr:uncharacterized mitochondrial protein AtMg00810-like [Tanacetum cinerariifolium]
DHAGCIDSRKSTCKGIQFLSDTLVNWMSKKHNFTAMSSAEAEYVALSASCAQDMWMRTQLQDYGLNYNKIPLYCDSQSAIAISCNPVQHSRTKHIHTRYHFKKEQAKYALEILHKQGMEKGQSIGTPMDTKPKLYVDLSGNPVDQTDHRCKIGSLMYLCSPDIVQAVSPSTPTYVHAEENNDDQAEDDHLPDDEFTNPLCAPVHKVAESSSRNIGNSNVPTFNQS